MKKFFLSFAVFVMALCANAQTNQYFWYNGNLMMGNPIAQIDSVTFGEGEPADTLHIMLPRTIIKTVHDTVYITIHDTVCPNDIPEGALNGLFSVSADKKVRFSKGNLQYQASTNTWRFAENQYDYIGDENENISSTYNGWIDIFGWGTGNNPTNYSTNTSEYRQFNDWGGNLPSIGEKTWYTPTYLEWGYLFEGRENANNLYGAACIDGINGVVILPDNWVDIEGITFNSGMSSSNSYVSVNNYTLLQWKALEENGAVFLPAAGYRYGKSYGSDGNGGSGTYWSSSITSNGAYNCDFHCNYMHPQQSGAVYFAEAVRLVIAE